MFLLGCVQHEFMGRSQISGISNTQWTWAEGSHFVLFVGTHKGWRCGSSSATDIIEIPPPQNVCTTYTSMLCSDE